MCVLGKRVHAIFPHAQVTSKSDQGFYIGVGMVPGMGTAYGHFEISVGHLLQIDGRQELARGCVFRKGQNEKGGSFHSPAPDCIPAPAVSSAVTSTLPGLKWMGTEIEPQPRSAAADQPDAQWITYHCNAATNREEWSHSFSHNLETEPPPITTTTERRQI